MKKLIFFLLFTVSFYGQTYQNPTYGTVTEKSNSTDNTPAYFTTTQVDGVHKKTPAANIEKTANKSDSYTTSSSTTYASTKALVDGLAVKNWIKSNESLSLAQRKGDVLYGILDQHTGEEITLSKVTGTPTVDGVIYFQLGAEYFKRNIANKVQAAWFGFRADGLSASSTANAAALQAAIDYCATLPTTHSIEFQGYEIQLPLGDSYCEQVNVKGQCMIVGEGKTTTRMYFVGTDYFLKGDVAFISHGGLRDLQINPAPGTTCLGLVYLKNAYNMNYTNVTLNGTSSVGVVSEAVVKMVSQQSWTVGANNNLYKIVFDNLNIYGSLGHGILITGDYGSAEMVVKNSIIENLDGHGICVTSTTNIANSNLKINNVIFQGGGLGALKLEAVLNADIQIYSETIDSNPIITLGSTTNTYNNIYIHDSTFGNGATGFGGAVIKTGGGFSGISLSNSGVVIENCYVLTVDTNDYLTEIYAQNVALKNIRLNGTTKLFKGNNYVDGGNNGLGNYTIDLTNRSYGASNLTEVNTGTIIPNDKISYWLGDRMVGTNTKQQKFLTSDDAIGKNDINSDIFLTGVSNLALGSINQYYSRKHFMFSIHNLSASPVTISIGDGGLINGSAIYTLAGYSSVDLHHSDTTTGVYAISITPSDSPTLTGTPTAPTATVGTNTTQIATTAFVQNIVSSGTFTPSSTGGITFKRCYWVKTGNVLDVVYNFSITGATSYTATMTLPNSFTINSNSNGIDIGGGKVTTNSGYSRLQETATSSDVYLSITSENTGTASGFARASILIN